MKLPIEIQGENNEMCEEMEDVCDGAFEFEDSVEIDLDFEFDVAKFFDLTRSETPEEIEVSEAWFECAKGHPPSPLVAKLGCGTYGSSCRTSSSMDGSQWTYSIKDGDICEASEVSSLDHLEKGEEMKSKLKSSYQECSPRIARLLRPTASHLAKQNQQRGACSVRVPGRLQKLGSPHKSLEDIAATKRQKLEINYLRKVAHLRHQAIFSHKTPKKENVTDANCYARPKVTVPKEPVLATAQRAQRHRSNNGVQSGDKSKCNCRSNNAFLHEKSEPDYKFKPRPFSNKIFSSKGDVGVFRTSKREATVPREFKLSNRKKPPQNPPIELFSKPGSLPEEKQTLQTRGLQKSTSFSIMKENKIPNSINGKQRTSCPKQSQLSEGNMMTDIGNHPSGARSFAIH
uniref:TPX2 central domain-containing protein n=1 Tax=Opuntia streptacantha TaxID=393608 RepID=A0A7C9DPZ4_OPUST